MTAAHQAMGSLEDQTAAAKDVGRKAVPFAEQTCPVSRFPPRYAADGRAELRSGRGSEGRPVLILSAIIPGN